MPNEEVNETVELDLLKSHASGQSTRNSRTKRKVSVALRLAMCSEPAPTRSMLRIARVYAVLAAP
jgi:hypothetical protein